VSVHPCVDYGPPRYGCFHALAVSPNLFRSAVAFMIARVNAHSPSSVPFVIICRDWSPRLGGRPPPGASDFLLHLFRDIRAALLSAVRRGAWQRRAQGVSPPRTPVFFFFFRRLPLAGCPSVLVVCRTVCLTAPAWLPPPGALFCVRFPTPMGTIGCGVRPPRGGSRLPFFFLAPSRPDTGESTPLSCRVEHLRQPCTVA